MFLEDKARPIPMGPQRPLPPPKKNGTMRAHSMRNDNQILHVDDQTRCENIFKGSTESAEARSVCGS